MGPIKKKTKQTMKRKEEDGIGNVENLRESILVFFFFSILFSQIHKNLTVRICRDKHEKCSTRRGLRVGTRNTGFHREFR